MVKGKAIKAVSFLWVGSLAGAGLGFLTQVIIARNLHTDDFGAFSSTLAAITLLIPLAGFGLPQFWLKVFGEEGWRAVRWLRKSLFFALLSTALIMCLIVLWAFIGEHSPATKVLFLMLLVFVLGQVAVEIISSKFQLEESYVTLAAWQLLPHLFRFSLVLVCVKLLESDNYFYGFGGAYLIGGALLLLFGAPHLYRLYHGSLDLVGHGERGAELFSVEPRLRQVILKSFPFGVAGSFHLIYFQSAIVLLSYLVGDREAGIYNVAFLVMAAIYLFPNIIYQKFLLPKIHRWANQNRDLFYKSYRLGSVAMLGIGGVASLLVWLLSPYLLPVLFGPAYNDSIETLRWLSLCAPLRFMATSVGSVLVTQDHMVSKIKCMGVVAGLNIVLSLLLVPKLSIFGALVATFLSEALLLGLYYFVVRRYVFNLRMGADGEL